MTGQQVEYVMRLIEGNMDLSRGEVAAYIRENQVAIAESLVETGKAVVKTSMGDLQIKISDLEAIPA